MDKHIIHLKNKTEAQAFMKFLIMERNRHIGDLEKIDRDISNLVLKWNIPIPAIPTHHWIEV